MANIQPILDYLASEQIQIKFQHRQEVGETFTQLELLLPSQNLRTLKVYWKFLDRRTSEEIKRYCQKKDVDLAAQLERSLPGGSIEITEDVE